MAMQSEQETPGIRLVLEPYVTRHATRPSENRGHLESMNENRREEIRGVFDKLAHMHREPWTHRGTSTADPIPLSTWSIFGDERCDGIADVIVLGLDDPGTFTELVQYTKGQLRGAALERQRVIVPQMVFIKHVVDILTLPCVKVPVHLEDSGFSQEVIEGLGHFNIQVVQDASRFIHNCSLVVDLRTEQGQVLDCRNMASINTYGGLTSPEAILKRCSTVPWKSHPCVSP